MTALVTKNNQNFSRFKTCFDTIFTAYHSGEIGPVIELEQHLVWQTPHDKIPGVVLLVCLAVPVATVPS